MQKVGIRVEESLALLYSRSSLRMRPRKEKRGTDLLLALTEGYEHSLRDRGPPQRRRTARVAGQRVALGNTNRAGRRSALAKTVEEGLEDLGTKVVESAKMVGECRGGSQNTWPVQS